MSQHPEHIANAIKLRERGWKWSATGKVWYRRVPGGEWAMATADTRAALAMTMVKVRSQKRDQG